LNTVFIKEGIKSGKQVQIHMHQSKSSVTNTALAIKTMIS
jgi:hypothetical protein